MTRGILPVVGGILTTTPFEPLYFAGLNIPKNQRWKVIFRPGYYCYSPPGGYLAANQIINQDVLHIEPASDFILMGVYQAGNNATPYILQLVDDRGYQLYGNFINSQAVSLVPLRGVGIVSYKTPHILRASGKLFVSIQIGALNNPQPVPVMSNTLQITFAGIKVFRVKEGVTQ